MRINTKLGIEILAIAMSMLGLFHASTAQAQVSDDIVDATTGLWLVASEDGSPGCRLRLQKTKTIGGYALKEEKPCSGPLHDTVYSWGFGDGTIELRDATRKVMMSFEEQEGGPWRTPEGVTPRIYFIPEPGKMQSVPVAKQLAGTAWVMTDSKGKSLCGLTLTSRPVPNFDDAFVLEPAKDCSAAVKKAKVTMWQVSEISLGFIGGEDTGFAFTLLPDGSFVSDDNKYKLVRAKN